MIYDKHFREGCVPEQLDLSGEWIVRGLIGRLPPLRVLLQKKVFRSRSASEIRGHNQFLGFLSVAPFYVERGPSEIEPELEVIKIVYDVPGNPGIVRRLTDEIRQLDDGNYLGRGIYNFPGVGARNTFWFTVERP